MRTLSFITVLLLLCGCARNRADCQTLAAQIHNDHIKWFGGIGSVGVESMGEPERRLVALGSGCRQSLINALDDTSRFVAAHVLLTTITRRHFPGNPYSYWNHLEVNLYADGHVDIPVAQKDKIRRLWTQK